jgi:hypothetical protein
MGGEVQWSCMEGGRKRRRWQAYSQIICIEYSSGTPKLMLIESCPLAAPLGLPAIYNIPSTPHQRLDS